MKPVLIIKTGRTVKAMPASYGDFEHWIMRGMRLPETCFSTVEVFKGASLPEPEGIAGVVITGSPAMVTDRESWSERTAAYIKLVMKLRIPLLGICYGHQLLCQSLGGKVDYHPKGREIGSTGIMLTAEAIKDPLFAGLPQEFVIHVTHSQSVHTPPPGYQLLGWNAHEPYQGIRFAENTWGVQFHPEFNADIMRVYIRDRAEALRAEGLNPEQLLDRVQEAPHAEQVLVNFARIIQNQH